MKVIFFLQNSSNIISNQQGSKTIQLKVAFLQFKKKQKKKTTWSSTKLHLFEQSKVLK